jgi:protein-S-isoprenylcysteine O-methyltransferase Ste14
MAVLPLGWYAVSWAARVWLHPHLELPAAIVWPARVAGGLLLAVGTGFFVRAFRALLAARRHGAVATTGPFACCRHPMYAAWVFWLVPGLALWSGSWPDLALPFVFYASFRLLIGREERRLAERFPEYAEYAARTRRIRAWP